MPYCEIWEKGRKKNQTPSAYLHPPHFPPSLSLEHSSLCGTCSGSCSSSLGDFFLLGIPPSVSQSVSQWVSHSLTDSLTHWLTHLLTHSLTHSLTQLPRRSVCQSVSVPGYLPIYVHLLDWSLKSCFSQIHYCETNMEKSITVCLPVCLPVCFSCVTLFIGSN